MIKISPRIAAAVAVLAIGLTAVGCSGLRAGYDGDDPYVGPFAEAVETVTFRVEAPESGLPIHLRATNLMGPVRIRPSEGDWVRIDVVCTDGYMPGRLVFADVEPGAPVLQILDSTDAGRDPRPEPPIDLEPWGVRRLGYKMPSIEVVIWAPTAARITIPACSSLTVEGSVDVWARCGSSANLIGGHGIAHIEAPKLLGQSCNYEVVAAISESANISGVVGDKWLRGTGTASVSGGSGVLNIAMGGQVFVDAPIGPGAPRTTPRERVAAPDGMIGPTSPLAGDRRDLAEASRGNSRVSGDTVEVRLPKESGIEVFVNVSNGPADVFIPERAGVVRPHAMTRSTLHFTVGSALGELRVEAVSRANVIVKP